MRRLKDWLSAYMEVQENSEPPKNYHQWVAISCIAAALQRKCWLEWGGGLTFYPNMYTVLVGPPGKTRKGTAMGVGERLIHSLELPVSAEATTREALIEMLEESKSEFIDRTTSQTRTHCSLTILSPELTVFLGHQNLVLMDNLTDWFDCKEIFTYRTKRSGTNVVKGVWVNLLGATTPEMLRTALPMNAIGGGFTSRVIFIYEDKKHKLSPCPFYTEEENQKLTDLELDLAHIATLQGRFKVTEEFINYWIEWYSHQDAHPPFTDPLFDGYISRRPTHVFKLSMICSVSRNDSMVIGVEDLKRAISLLESAEVKMPQAFNGVGRSAQADVIANLMIEISQRKTTTFGELLTFFIRDVDAKTLENMLDSLHIMGYCTFKRNQNLEKAIVAYIEKPVVSL